MLLALVVGACRPHLDTLRRHAEELQRITEMVCTDDRMYNRTLHIVNDMVETLWYCTKTA